MQLPTTGSPPFAAIIGVGSISLSAQRLRAMGVAIVTFNNNEIAQQSSGTSRGLGLFYQLYGHDSPTGAVMGACTAGGAECGHGVLR